MVNDNIRSIRMKIAAADEDTLIGLANKGTYKRACKDAEGVTPEFTEGDDFIEVSFGGEKVKLKDPLDKSECSCPSRTICRHIVGALVLMKSVVPAEETAPPPAAEKADEPEKAEDTAEKNDTPPAEEAPAVNAKLSAKDEAKVHDCAALCRELINEILTDGLVRVSPDMPARIEAAAVRCHGAGAASAERIMRSLGSRLSEHIGRRAAFDVQYFAQSLCYADKYITGLQRDGLTEDDLGEFRRSYEDVRGELVLLPIGIKEVLTGEYVGRIYYFLDENRVTGRDHLIMSDLRPRYYEQGTNRRRNAPIVPWDLGVPIKNAMRDRITLHGAKVSGEKLSSSGSTRVVSQTKASLNTAAVHRLVIDDFRQIAAELDEAGSFDTDRLFFVRPASCNGQRFDRYTQTYIMDIADWRGCHITVRAKYRAETKEFVELLEKIGKRMIKDKDVSYTLLAEAQVEDGELTLFPIEVYDFITPPDDTQYFLPEKYDDAAECAGYAQALLELFAKLRQTMTTIVHCGLRTGIRDEDRLITNIKNCGLAGLAEPVQAMFRAAGEYRHNTGGSAAEVMVLMDRIYEYIKAGERKLQTISALAKMQPGANDIPKGE